MMCPICGGGGSITLPRRPDPLALSCVPPADDRPSISQTSATYPCPECSDTMQTPRLIVVAQEEHDHTQLDDDNYLHTVLAHCARGLVEVMIRDGLVAYQRIERGMGRTSIRASVGIVGADAVLSMADRIAERQSDLANATVAIAKDKISHFRSAEAGYVPKGAAADLLVEALREATVKWERINGPRKG